MLCVCAIYIASFLSMSGTQTECFAETFRPHECVLYGLGDMHSNKINKNVLS